MGTIFLYVLIPTAVIVVAWIVSWWGRQPARWLTLGGAAGLSLFCFVVGVAISPPPPQRGMNFFDCTTDPVCSDWTPEYWMAAGLLGLACTIVLLVVTWVVEFVLIGWAALRRHEEGDDREPVDDEEAGGPGTDEPETAGQQAGRG